MKLAPSTVQFLASFGEKNASLFRSSGKPVPDHIYNTFKILSMLEVLLRTASPEALSAVDKIADWKQ